MENQEPGDLAQTIRNVVMQLLSNPALASLRPPTNLQPPQQPLEQSSQHQPLQQLSQQQPSQQQSHQQLSQQQPMQQPSQQQPLQQPSQQQLLQQPSQQQPLQQQSQQQPLWQQPQQHSMMQQELRPVPLFPQRPPHQQRQPLHENVSHSLTGELRSCFTSKRRRSSTGRQAAKQLKKERTYTKNVVLLDPGMQSIPTDRALLSESGRIIHCFKFKSTDSSGDMVFMIRELFPSKLGHIPEPGFKVVKADRNRVFMPNLPPNTEVDGETIAKLCGNGQLYIMATGVIGDTFNPNLYLDDREKDEEDDGEINGGGSSSGTRVASVQSLSVNLQRLPAADLSTINANGSVAVPVSNSLSSSSGTSSSMSSLSVNLQRLPAADLSTIIANGSLAAPVSNNLSSSSGTSSSMIRSEDLPSHSGYQSSFAPSRSTSPSSELEGISHTYDVTSFVPLEFIGDEQAALEKALQDSMTSTNDCNKEAQESPRIREVTLSQDAICGLMQAHSEKVVRGPTRSVTVSRRKVWQTSLPYFERKSFMSGTGLLVVTFSGGDEASIEDGCDLGGPRREFFRLLRHDMIHESAMLQASPDGMVIRPNFTKYREGLYGIMGQMLAVMVTQGGEAPVLFTPSIMTYIITGDILKVDNPSIDEIPDEGVRTDLQKINDSSTEEDLSKILTGADWRYQVPGAKMIVTLENRVDFVNEMILYFTLIRSQAMLDQLITGLKYYEVLELLRQHPSMRVLLQATREMMTAEELLTILRPRYSLTNINRKEQEELVTAAFKRIVFKIADQELEDLLDEGRMTPEMVEFVGKLKVSNIMAFVTGAANRPVTGFLPRPSICFIHDVQKHHPAAQTCANELQLFVNNVTTDAKELAFYLLTSLMNGSVFSTI